MKRCTLPELAEMAARARIEYTQHVCPIHRIHEIKNHKLVDADTILPNVTVQAGEETTS